MRGWKHLYKLDSIPKTVPHLQLASIETNTDMMGSIANVVLLFCFIPLFYFPHAQNAPVNSASDSRCIESEWKALMEFKASVFDEHNYLSSWTGRDCCSWKEITCHNLTGHVQMLELYGFDGCQLNSPLSPWVFNLSHLEVLTMGNCWLLGSIPNMFEKLTSLTTLDLSFNSFESEIFPHSLCSLTNLNYMILSDSQLRGSLPSCLGNLTSLTVFDVAYNELGGEIPGWLGNLTHLNYLSLRDNRFNSSIPFSFGNLQQLEYLDLSDNQLFGTIPPTWGNLTKLTSLAVSDNSLVGELSESVLEGLKSLDFLDISWNHHIVLNVSPQWIPEFNILHLSVDSVFIGTQFPPWLQTQSNLEVLIMRNTSIFGAIPDWYLIAFPNLTHFDLSHNCLTGNIPTNLCHLKSPGFVAPGNNQFTGVIPSCLGTLSKLIDLHVGNNNLSGHIPNELGSLNQLHYLHLNGNNFSGELPSSLQNLTLLITLDLGGNQLQGSIPQWFGKNLPSLQYLRLESNKFSGEIPVNLCQLPSLHILNLALNNLIGTIPPCFGSLKMIHNSGLENLKDPLLNIFKGREREYTSNLRYAKFISLSGNHLHGEIPIELMNLKGLQSLNLSNNELSGMIPKTINNLKQLESLDLSMNRLSGTIPQSLASIDALSYLNLSFNNFTGKVPSGNHFDTLDDPSIYEGNVELCGKLPMKSCLDDASPNGPNSDVDADKEFEFVWLYAGIGPGFAVGFLGVFFILYFKDPWRIAYFAFVDNVYNQVRVTFTIKFSQFRSKFN